METGTVKWFNKNNGYGFISPTEGGKEIFVHATNVQGKELREGDDVEYEIGEGKKGAAAINVKVV